ncbi:membrane protein [Pseudomonas chlororaphis]|uniref:Membrane protein n=1 Tax=Pseudomonas chlororaphis TaxID=587753 RepID=A0A0G3GC08_9PSED|nr:membrane protein [Pseudomonas chlororaphis]
MKPSRLLLTWLAVLLAVSILLGALRALGVALPATLLSIDWGLMLALLALALIDAVRLKRLPSPRVQRQMPGSLALGRWGEVRLDITHDFAQPLQIQLFDHVPDGLDFDNLPLSVELQPGQRSQIGYRLRPLKRGHFSFEHCEVSLPSPLDLWSDRRLLDALDATRVYPDFARLYDGQLLAVDNWLSQLGIRQRQRRGQGQEFHQLREFREGDSLRQIDWKATARHRTPIAREYEDERDQQIIFMLDCGRRMRSQDGELSHFDHALNACLLLSYTALRQGDAVGLSTFASDQARYLAPVKGSGQLNVLLNAVYDLDSSQRPADYQAAVTQLLARQKRRALVVLVTNLRDEDDEELLAAVKRLGQQHRVLVASLREEALDRLRQAPVQTLPEALAYCGTVDYLNARAQLHQQLSAHAIPTLDARPSELGAQLVTQYLAWKKAGTA